MSWRVESLLRRKVEIRTAPDFESDDYNDLLVIEKKIKDLIELGIITEEEQRLLEYLSDGKPMVNSKRDIGKHRMYVYQDFSNLCTKISFYLGGSFTNEGYISYMTNKYKLNSEQVEKLRKYMISKNAV